MHKGNYIIKWFRRIKLSTFKLDIRGIFSKVRGMKIRTIIFCVCAVTWMCVIFYYSHRPAEVSAQDSYEVGMMTGRVVIEDFEEWSFVDQLAFAMKVDHPIRKLAHFTEYFILAVLLFGAVDSSKRRTVLRWLIPWLISTLYAVSDEVHQYFIPGRNCNVLDVIIDSSGACVGALVCLGVVALYRRRHV